MFSVLKEKIRTLFLDLTTKKGETRQPTAIEKKQKMFLDQIKKVEEQVKDVKSQTVASDALASRLAELLYFDVISSLLHCAKRDVVYHDWISTRMNIQEAQHFLRLFVMQHCKLEDLEDFLGKLENK